MSRPEPMSHAPFLPEVSAEPVPSPAPRRRWRPRTVDWRPKLRWFASEYLIVVLGVLTAVGINAWWQGRQDAASEATYLALLSRDLGQLSDDLEELRDFETSQIEGGFAAYRVLSARDRSAEARTLVSDVVAGLTVRRTMRLTNPAYQDLLSTGNLGLIRDRALRDRVVSFYEWTEREFDIHNRNNASYVDDLFKDAMFRDGLFVFRGPAQSTFDATNEADSLFAAETRGGYADDPDPIWTLPDASPEWQMVRGQLLSRIRISLYGRLRARDVLARTREMKAAIDAERDR